MRVIRVRAENLHCLDRRRGYRGRRWRRGQRLRGGAAIVIQGAAVIVGAQILLYPGATVSDR